MSVGDEGYVPHSSFVTDETPINEKNSSSGKRDNIGSSYQCPSNTKSEDVLNDVAKRPRKLIVKPSTTPNRSDSGVHAERVDIFKDSEIRILVDNSDPCNFTLVDTVKGVALKRRVEVKISRRDNRYVQVEVKVFEYHSILKQMLEISSTKIYLVDENEDASQRVVN